MSKHQKLLEKLRKKPPPTDFRWEDLVSVMENARFTASCGSGSHHVFEHVCGEFRAFISKPHPAGILLKYQIRDALAALEHTCKEKEKENE